MDSPLISISREVAKKTVTWIEDNPRLQQKDKDSDKVVREIPLTADEVKQEYRRLFTKHKNEGKSITLEDTDQVVHIIDLTDVRNIELTSKEENNNIFLSVMCSFIFIIVNHSKTSDRPQAYFWGLFLFHEKIVGTLVRKRIETCLV